MPKQPRETVHIGGHPPLSNKPPTFDTSDVKPSHPVLAEGEMVELAPDVKSAVVKPPKASSK